jgi:hypothetical protein
MKSDADTIRSFLLGLLELFSRTESSPSGKVDDSDGLPSRVEATPKTAIHHRFVPEGSPNLSGSDVLSTFINDMSIEMPPIAQLGDLPAVQDHFQAVLKRRLQAEISQNPPLFPWESNIKEYPAELSEASPFPWMMQLRSLQLPTTLPEDILAGLLNRCEELISESLQPGIQLVKAVENLFPDQPQAMNQIAGLVLTNATVRGTATQDTEALKAAFPEGYEGANPQQQVTLTMLAAKDILDTLTVTLSPANPAAQREWLTTEGKVTLSAQFQAGTPNQISLSVEVPRASQLSMPSLGQTVAQTRPGSLNLTLPEPSPNVCYPLEIHFSELDAVPLTFALRWVE